MVIEFCKGPHNLEKLDVLSRVKILQNVAIALVFFKYDE